MRRAEQLLAKFPGPVTLHPGTPLPDPDVVVPDKYGLKADELAWLMNAWRAKALGEKPPH